MKKALIILIALTLLLGSIPGFAEGEKTTIVFTHWGSPFERDCLEQACRNYEKLNPDIIIKNIYIPGTEYTAKIATMLAGNQQLDCGFVSYTDLYVWGAEGRFVNIYDFIDQDPEFSREEFLDGTFFETEPGKVSYGWFIASEPRAMFYNKALFDKAGIPYPSSDRLNPMSWEEFVEIAQKLTLDYSGNNAQSPNFDPNSIAQYGVSVGGAALDKYLPLIYNGGGRVFEEDGKFALDSDASIAAIKNIQDLIFKYHVMPHPADLKNMPSGVIGISSGQVAMLCDGHWNLLDLGQLGFDYGCAVLPVMNGVKEFYITNDCAPISVFKGPHEQKAYEFLKYLADPAGCPPPFEGGLWFPILKRSVSDEALATWAIGPAHPDGFHSTFVDSLLNGQKVLPYYWRTREKTPEFETLLNTKFEKIFIEGGDVAQILKEEIRPAVDKIFG